MPAQQPTNDLLIKYLLNEVNAAEEDFVTQWLAADPLNLQHFQAFEKVWLLSSFTGFTNAIEVDDEWAAFKQRIAENGSRPVPVSQQETYPLHGQPPAGKRKIMRRIVAAVAVAASITALVFTGKFLFTSQVSKTPVLATAPRPKDSIAVVLRHEINTTGKPKKLLLQDGTIVMLEDKSELRFTEPFAAGYRSVMLTGKANFKVAKDAARPFTVFSDAVATTVLGTVFYVAAYPQASTITVRLYEGKVVVNAAPAALRKLKAPVYLSPGYEMIYDKQNALATVQPFNAKQPVVKIKNNSTGPSNIDSPNIPKKAGSWFMFNNQPLSHVLSQLQEMYKTPIVFNKKDVQKLYFIGQFNREDSISVILEQIARLNNLTITQNNDTFILKK